MTRLQQFEEKTTNIFAASGFHKIANIHVGETGASPPTGHVRLLALTSLKLFFGNSVNMTLLHIHQCTSHGNMRLASQKSRGG